MVIAFAFSVYTFNFPRSFFLEESVQTGYVVVFSVREIWWEEGQKNLPVVGVVVAGYVALPGDGGHGSLPGDCLGIHCVGCVSYLEHCIMQLNSEFFFMLYIYLHLGYSFTLYVLLYKITVPALCVFCDGEISTTLCEAYPHTVRCS